MLIASINLMLKREERLRLIQFYMLGSVRYNFEKPFLNYFFFFCLVFTLLVCLYIKYCFEIFDGTFQQ